MEINKEKFETFLKEYLKANMKISVDYVDKDDGYNAGKIHTVKISIGEDEICSSNFTLD